MYRNCLPFWASEDVVNSLDKLPGVNTIGEGASGFNVRGGRVDQNLIQITLGNGTTYRSEPETIPMAIAKDSMYLEITTKEEFSDSGVLVEKDVINTFVNTSIPETEKPLFLRWKLEEVYSFRKFDNPNPLALPTGFLLCHAIFHTPGYISLQWRRIRCYAN